MENLDYPFGDEMVPMAKLRIDPNYQRQITFTNVNDLNNKLDMRIFYSLRVSKRKDGFYYILDGQHRYTRMLRENYGGSLRCDVFTGLSRKQEAEIFELSNIKTKRLSAYDLYRSGLAQGHPDCIAVREICQRHGFEVVSPFSGKINSGSKLMAVGQLRKIVTAKKRVEGGLHGEELLDRTLNTCSALWIERKSGIEGHLIAGIAKLYNNHPENKIDNKTLVEELKLEGPIGIQQQAVKISCKGMNGGGGRESAFYRAVVVLYNRGTKSKIKATH